ncbi:tetratricopeptide repeat protein [bacterium]|nr:tetratricopeptide repeat protein [bacterium]MDC0309068.1 tetratricopeptide repeat protein [bacterium]
MTKLAQLQHPDPMHLKAASGWIQLGDYDSANDELEKIRAEWRAHPDVLELRWLIYSHDEQWDACLDIASAVMKIAPDRATGWVDKALSLRRANGGGIEKAKAVLDEAAKLFPTEWTVQYNLACYCSQLGQLYAAQEYLNKSYELGDAQKIKLMALDDEDLKPLWEGEAK